MLRQLARYVDLAVDDESLAPLDIALNDDALPYRGDALGGVRSAVTLSSRRWRTTHRSIVSKLRLNHREVTLDSSRAAVPETVHASPSSAPT